MHPGMELLSKVSVWNQILNANDGMLKIMFPPLTNDLDNLTWRDPSTHGSCSPLKTVSCHPWNLRHVHITNSFLPEKGFSPPPTPAESSLRHVQGFCSLHQHQQSPSSRFLFSTNTSLRHVQSFCSPHTPAESSLGMFTLQTMSSLKSQGRIQDSRLQ